jgi:hypothetical protein
MTTRERAMIDQAAQGLVEELTRMVLAKVDDTLRQRGLARVATRGSGGGTGSGTPGPAGPPGPPGPPGEAAGGSTLLLAGACHDAGTIQALIDDLYCRLNAVQSNTPSGFGNGGFGVNGFGA